MQFFRRIEIRRVRPQHFSVRVKTEMRKIPISVYPFANYANVYESTFYSASIKLALRIFYRTT